MVQSFGRPREPEMVDVQDPSGGVPFPIIHLPVVPVLDEAALESLAQMIQARVAAAVSDGFSAGFGNVERALADGEDVDGDAGCADTDAADPAR